LKAVCQRSFGLILLQRGSGTRAGCFGRAQTGEEAVRRAVADRAAPPIELGRYPLAIPLAQHPREDDGSRRPTGDHANRRDAGGPGVRTARLLADAAHASGRGSPDREECRPGGTRHPGARSAGLRRENGSPGPSGWWFRPGSRRESDIQPIATHPRGWHVCQSNLRWGDRLTVEARRESKRRDPVVRAPAFERLGDVVWWRSVTGGGAQGWSCSG